MRKNKLSKCIISKSQNTEGNTSTWQNVESRLSKLQNVEKSKYRKTKYRMTKYRMQNTESNIPIGKMSNTK